MTFVQDIASSLGPDKRFGVDIVMRNVFIDCADQLGHAREHATTQALHRDVAKGALHHVQPRGRSGREMHVKMWPFGEPLLHGRMLVGGLIVDDQMQLFLGRRLALDLPQKLQPLYMTVTLLALSDDLVIQYVERREQHGRAVALVVMRHRRSAPLLQWQPAQAACGPAPALGSSHRSTAPVRALVGSYTNRRYLRASPRTAGRARL